MILLLQISNAVISLLVLDNVLMAKLAIAAASEVSRELKDFGTLTGARSNDESLDLG